MTPSAQHDSFDLPALDRDLAGTPFAGQIRYFPSIHSTNTLAMKEADEGAANGVVYIADEQTAGRGRGDHAWHSAPGSGLYVSILLRPKLAPADVLWLSLAAGLAVHDAVREVSALEADIRWPNDLLFGPKKFGGILTELNAEVTRVRHAVIGIGINVHQEKFPEDLAPIATSLAIESGRHWSRQDLLVALLDAIDREATTLTAPGELATATAGILKRLDAASSWVRGKRVTVEEDGGYSGVTDGLDARGFLRVRAADGLRTVFSGGVRAST
jgi:BirA family biotin operon repressor/biotin-[acetyl-CoA-carboxylase] ligase